MAEDKKDKSVEKEFRFSMRPERQEGESFEEYKARRKLLKAMDKQKKSGKLFWPSRFMGAYYTEFKGQEEQILQQTLDYIKAHQERGDDSNNS